jgi:hypothetical protein
MDFEAQVPVIDRGVLTGPVRCVLSSDTAEIEAWDYHLLYGGLGIAIGVSAIYRIAGTARDGGPTRPWSLVLKVLCDPTGGSALREAPADGWDREVHAYRSGLLDHLPDGPVARRGDAGFETALGRFRALLRGEELVEREPARTLTSSGALAAANPGDTTAIRSASDLPCPRHREARPR